jgi:hypothetical protein
LNDAAFLDGANFDFGLTEFDANTFDFGMYLAEMGDGDGDGGMVGVE